MDTKMWRKVCRNWGAAGLVAGLLAWGSGSARAAGNLTPLKVEGTQLLDGANKRVRLRGVNAPSLEWDRNGEGHILETVRVALKDWHVNIIRLPVAQDSWFGKMPDQADSGTAYRALVRQVIDLCYANNCYVILDLHWNDAGQWGQNVGQHVMPDENSLLFWKSAATEYKNNPAVIFDLYNEPHDVSWDIWRDGGQVTEGDGKGGTRTYKAVGMQPLLNAVRETGAKNVALIGGLNWAYDFDGILAGRQLKDTTGRGVMYANHAYPQKGESVAVWTKRMETATKTLPVFVGEFGSDPGGGVGETGESWVRHVLQVIQDHDWNWTAWDLHPAATPKLVSDWEYHPTAHFGVWVKQALNGTLAHYTPPDPALMVAPALTTGAVYAGGLANGWQSYGWAKLDYGNTSPVHGGKTSIKIQAGPYEAMFLHHEPFRIGAMRNLTFWIHGGPRGGQSLKVQATIGGKPQTVFTLPKLMPNTWRMIVVPLAGVGITEKSNMDGFWIESLSAAPAPPFYVDDIAFTP